MSEIRVAITSTRVPLSTVQRYLPSNYTAAEVDNLIVISGEDMGGWTLDEYVLPRLASGGIYASEIPKEVLDAQPRKSEEIAAEVEARCHAIHLQPCHNCAVIIRLIHQGRV